MGHVSVLSLFDSLGRPARGRDPVPNGDALSVCIAYSPGETRELFTP